MVGLNGRYELMECLKERSSEFDILSSSRMSLRIWLPINLILPALARFGLNLHSRGLLPNGIFGFGGSIGGGFILFFSRSSSSLIKIGSQLETDASALYFLG